MHYIVWMGWKRKNKKKWNDYGKEDGQKSNKKWFILLLSEMQLIDKTGSENRLQ